MRIGRRRLLIAAIAAAIAVPAIGSSTAGAAFHLIKVREVYPGASNDSYVVLQMLAPNENQLGGHSLRLYDAGGGTIHTFTFTGGIYGGYVAPNASHGNNTVLVGDTGVQATLGVAPDDHADANLNVPAGGGAVCWLSGSPIDCVSWGNFTGGGSLPSPAGTPADALGIPAGMALRRTIARRCATLLEEADDSDDSAADFFDAFPAPRPNSVAPSERPCGAAGPGTGESPGQQGSGRSRPPQTWIVRRPRKVTRDRTPTFGFRSNRRGSTFLCKVDRKRFRRCRSPFTLRRLRFGRHVFRVKARAGGRVDPSPATYRFRVVRGKRRS